MYGSYIIKLRLIDEPILTKYLCAYLNSILGRMQFERVKTGSAQFNINLDQIRETEIIEPSSEVQEDIAILVSKLLEQLFEMRKIYTEKLQQAKNLFIEHLTS